MLVLQSPTFSQTEGVLLLQDTLYDPFRRHDAYGCMGQGPLPLRESMRLALAAVFVLPVKVRPPDAACKALGWPQHGCLHSLPLLSKRQVASPACAGCAFSERVWIFGCPDTGGASATSHAHTTCLHIQECSIGLPTMHLETLQSDSRLMPADSGQPWLPGGVLPLMPSLLSGAQTEAPSLRGGRLQGLHALLPVLPGLLAGGVAPAAPQGPACRACCPRWGTARWHRV